MESQSMIPKLSFQELTPELQELLAPKVKRLGYLGEFFRFMGHQPRALANFYRMTEELRSALPNSLAQVVALTVSSILGNVYERVQHERLTLKLGLGEEWLREVLSLEPERAVHLSLQERAVQKFVMEALARMGRETSCQIEAVVKELGPVQAVAVLMLTGRYVMHSLVTNCLDLAAPVRSPVSGEDAPAGVEQASKG